ncbi:MAG: DNA repair protein RecN [Plesiomonas sp.]|uniref:DNA repair protein RecN n=1 Tax=Plesiomonas sp. TaxID=2486279 RepID=UPI003F40AFFC
MLAQLTITNFAIVRELAIDFHRGMTTVTGETGAGKSIAIDALGLCLGDRAEAAMVRTDAKRAEVSATFLLQGNPSARRWLEDNQLDESDECILRRVISADGRSKAFINGTPVPASQLRELGHQLIHIHGQHAHQRLLKSEYQLALLDAYAGHHSLLEDMRNAYQLWREQKNALKAFEKNKLEREARLQLLQYHVKELDDFGLAEDEFSQIDDEYKRLSNSGDLIQHSQESLQVLDEADEGNVLSLLRRAQLRVNECAELDARIAPLTQMLDEATIHIQEVCTELRQYLDCLDLEPERLLYLEQRLSKAMQLARKHHIHPDELPTLHLEYHNELALLLEQEVDGDHFEQRERQYWAQMLESAEKLSQSRQRYADDLARLITQSMAELSMENGRFFIEIHSNEQRLTPLGFDQIDFTVTTNPGQPAQPLGKVASGGELSRISLAIQVITAKKVDTPSLIFDEVDVGISGPTAAVVGKLLRQLGESTQVLCVTHLPQVAGCGHNHYFVSKYTDGQMTETHMTLLNQDDRLNELARLLGGSQITENTLANARELLAA